MASIFNIDVGTGAPPPPTGQQNNIVADYSWTVSPKGDPVRKEVPRVIVDEYQLIQSAVYGAYERWVYSVKNFGNSDDPYWGLYPSRTTNNKYTFPFFSESYRKIEN